jgi:hypothetical protein
MSSLFGLDPSERLVFVGEVARGLACQCRCVVCKEPLIARQGMVREHHFAHASGADPCDASHESMLHVYAKQVIIQEAGGLAVPVDTAVQQALGFDTITGIRGWLPLARVEAERRLQSIRLDLLASTDSGVAVAIEVAYSSFCDLLKVAEFERIRLPALEIDLRRFSPEGFDPNALRAMLIEEIVGNIWLWPRSAEEEPASAPPATPSAPGCSVIPETKAHLPEEIITFSGRWVSVKKFPSGDIAVKVVRYDPDLVSLVKTIAKANYGSYSPRWKSWNVPRWRPETVRSEL